MALKLQAELEVRPTCLLPRAMCPCICSIKLKTASVVESGGKGVLEGLSGARKGPSEAT